MITVEKVKIDLAELIISAPGFVNGEFTFVESIHLDEGLSVTVKVFAELFSDAEDLTADELLRVDGGAMGYEKYILEWQAKGYIK